MSNHDRREDQRPDPPFPDDERLRKPKRRRDALPCPRVDPTTLPRVNTTLRSSMTSTEKGLGRQACFTAGAHDWVADRIWGHWLVFCRRCCVWGKAKS